MYSIYTEVVKERNPVYPTQPEEPTEQYEHKW